MKRCSKCKTSMKMSEERCKCGGIPEYVCKGWGCKCEKELENKQQKYCLHCQQKRNESLKKIRNVLGGAVVVVGGAVGLAKDLLENNDNVNK